MSSFIVVERGQEKNYMPGTQTPITHWLAETQSAAL
jgi:hypothetical protein